MWRSRLLLCAAAGIGGHAGGGAGHHGGNNGENGSDVGGYHAGGEATGEASGYGGYEGGGMEHHGGYDPAVGGEGGMGGYHEGMGEHGTGGLDHHDPHGELGMGMDPTAVDHSFGELGELGLEGEEGALEDNELGLDGADSTHQVHPPQEPSKQQAEILSKPYKVIDTKEALTRAMDALRDKPVEQQKLALDVEAFCTPGSDQRHLGQISLLQICSPDEPNVHIIDVLKLGVPTVQSEIGPILQSNQIRKLMFDCRRDVEALSIQMQLKPQKVTDLQLFHTAVQWKAKGASRRSGLSYVLKSVLGMDRQEGDNAVQAAMTLGNRAVWDVRPLPDNFLEYAADDVRHVLLLAEALGQRHPERVDGVERLTSLYVDHYSIGKPVLKEADPAAHQVLTDWLERFLGPAGVCGFCGVKGHVEQECFKKHSGVAKCAHCGEIGHLAPNCYRKSPQLLKCNFCGQLGHTEQRCFAKKPCTYCGGKHPSETCNNKLDAKFAEEDAKEEKEPIVLDPITTAMNELKSASK